MMCNTKIKEGGGKSWNHIFIFDTLCWTGRYVALQTDQESFWSKTRKSVLHGASPDSNHYLHIPKRIHCYSLQIITIVTSSRSKHTLHQKNCFHLLNCPTYSPNTLTRKLQIQTNLDFISDSAEGWEWESTISKENILQKCYYFFNIFILTFKPSHCCVQSCQCESTFCNWIQIMPQMICSYKLQKHLKWALPN